MLLNVLCRWQLYVQFWAGEHGSWRKLYYRCITTVRQLRYRLSHCSEYILRCHSGRSAKTIRPSLVEYAIAAVGSQGVSDDDVDLDHFDKMAGDYAQRLATANRIWASQHRQRLASGEHWRGVMLL